MATKKPKGGGRGQGPDDDGSQETDGLEEGGAVQVHEAYLRERQVGGRAPDANAYSEALEQFERLPGALRSTPPVLPTPVEDIGGQGLKGAADDEDETS